MDDNGLVAGTRLARWTIGPLIRGGEDPGFPDTAPRPRGPGAHRLALVGRWSGTSGRRSLGGSDPGRRLSRHRSRPAPDRLPNTEGGTLQNVRRPGDPQSPPDPRACDPPRPAPSPPPLFNAGMQPDPDPPLPPRPAVPRLCASPTDLGPVARTIPLRHNAAPHLRHRDHRPPARAMMMPDWSGFGPCPRCGADAGEPCTVGQYGTPSPHASARVAAEPHTSREATG